MCRGGAGRRRGPRTTRERARRPRPARGWRSSPRPGVCTIVQDLRRRTWLHEDASMEVQSTTTEQGAAFLLFAVVAAVTPGPSNIMLTTAGANAGVLRGLPCLFGVATGMGLMMFLVPLGLGSVVLEQSAGTEGAPLGRRRLPALALLEDRDVERERRPPPTRIQWAMSEPRPFSGSTPSRGSWPRARRGRFFRWGVGRRSCNPRGWAACSCSRRCRAASCGWRSAPRCSTFSATHAGCESSTSPWACSWRSRSS